MLAYALVQVSGCVPDIICVAQITLKFIDHALLVYNGRLLLLRGEDLADLLRLKDRLEASDGTSNIVVPLPFKDQKSANSVKREMQNLSAKIGVQIKPVFAN